MTHFGVVVSLLAGLFALLSGIFGMTIRMSAAWQRVKDVVEYIQKDLVKMISEKDKIHGDHEERLRKLEDRRRN